VVLAVDVSSVPAFSEWWFRGLYAVAGVSLVLWHRWRLLWALSAFGVSLVTASAVRALLLTLEGDRWAGAAINLILAVTVNFNVNQRRERHHA
jgi:hypothetical protein